MKHIVLLGSLMTLICIACRKGDQPVFDTTAKGSLSIEFDNIAGNADLQLTTGTYTNASGEVLSITLLKYYVSNFVLTNVDGTVYTVPQDSCYFLIDESAPGTHRPSFQLPEGEYKTLSFLIGVDSLRNTKEVSERKGVLDPLAEGGDMYWGWNSGYIFFKMEGVSPASASPGSAFMYHIGGFGGYNSGTINNLKKVTIDLTERGTPTVRAGRNPNIHLFADVMKIFSGTGDVRIAQHPVVMFDDFSTTIAANYASMVSHDHTEN